MAVELYELRATVFDVDRQDWRDKFAKVISPGRTSRLLKEAPDAPQNARQILPAIGSRRRRRRTCLFRHLVLDVTRVAHPGRCIQDLQ